VAGVAGDFHEGDDGRIVFNALISEEILQRGANDGPVVADEVRPGSSRLQHCVMADMAAAGPAGGRSCAGRARRFHGLVPAGGRSPRAAPGAGLRRPLPARLSGLAVAQPLLDLFGKNPEFFVAPRPPVARSSPSLAVGRSPSLLTACSSS
jgi:hypothetical protein